MWLLRELALGAERTDAEYSVLVRHVIAAGDCGGVRKLFLLANRHAPCWEGEAGTLLLAELLGLLLDKLEVGEVDAAILAMGACPTHLADRAYDLLHSSAFPDGEPAELPDIDDATLLCLALLTGTTGRTAEVGPFLDRAAAGRHAAFFKPPAAAIVAHFSLQAVEVAFEPKLVIWDLDDTLWQGTLAEGDVPVLDRRRAALVRTLNERGIVSAICSKNNVEVARAVLEGFGLWDAFVFPRIAFLPKGPAIRRLISDMGLRADNVLFVDDNPHNLHEVAALNPGIRVIDACDPHCGAMLGQIADDHAHIKKDRVAAYRLLETKVADRDDHALSDDDFLLQSGIEATFTDRMDNLEFAERIAELINRSNQLNYTQSRIEPGVVERRIQDIDHYEVLAAFVWDRYGYYGLVGAAVYNYRTNVLEHLAFSCRVMHMGIEPYLLRVLEKRRHRINAADLKKPLPAQTAQAVTERSFADPAVRARVLAQEAPRDWSKIQLRIMADCQSGAFHHYSRFRSEADFDNNPRLFSLPHLLTGEWRDQHFPPFLVYAAANDYIITRWTKLCHLIDLAVFRACAERYGELLVAGDRRCLMFLPPEGGPLERYELYDGCDAEWSHAIHPPLNAIWREVAARHPDHITLIELAEVVSPAEMIQNHHYTPATLKRIAGMIDGWYDRHRQAQPVLPMAA